MYALYAFAAGLIFGIGLIVSEMFNPAKVLAFLDVAGKWDPSLLLVMGGAVAVGMIAFAFAGRRTTTLIDAPMHMPTAREIDAKLIGGSAVFGIGWGLAGFCPGPAVVGLGTGHVKPFLFVVAMVAGMAVHELIERRRAHAPGTRAATVPSSSGEKVHASAKPDHAAARPQASPPKSHGAPPPHGHSKARVKRGRA